jgi:hypothetical protein
MKTLNERTKDFKKRIWIEIGENFNTYSKEMLIEFTDYWCEISINGKKMRFEKEKVFSISRRLKTWKNNSLSWNKSPEKSESLPNYFNKTLWQRLEPERIKEYKEHLSRLGWHYSASPGGTYWRSPDNKMIWL